MAIITISRGSYSHGKTIAEKVSQTLGYECIAREILFEASKGFNIPELKLFRAIQDAPSILDRFVYGKEKYIAYTQTAFFRYLKKDNVVYHGFAGHFFVKDIQHVLKVRIIADLEDRVSLVTERDGISRKEALRFLRKLDEQRKKWSKHLYGIDTWDSSLYDLIIHVGKITVDHAANIICNTIKSEHFQTSLESQLAMNDLFLAAEVKAALIEIKPDIDVLAQNGIVYVKTGAIESKEVELTGAVKKSLETIPGIKDIKIQVPPITPYANELM